MRAPAKILIWNPCPFGLPEMLTVARMAAVRLHNSATDTNNNDNSSRNDDNATLQA